MDPNWKLLLTKSGIKTCVQICADQINAKFKGQKLILVCVLKGAVPFFTDLTRLLEPTQTWCFVGASSYQNEQKSTNTTIITGEINPSEFEGRQVVIVDELLDGGHTLKAITEAIHIKGNVPLDRIHTCVLIQKQKSKPTEMQVEESSSSSSHKSTPDFVGITLPDVWLVGYGLDDRQEQRNLYAIYACPKSDPALESEHDQIFKNPEYYQKTIFGINLWLESKNRAFDRSRQMTYEEGKNFNKPTD